MAYTADVDLWGPTPLVAASVAASLTAPSTLVATMPDPAWGNRRDMSKPGYGGRPLTAADLAADPQGVLMRATPYDGIAAAITDAFNTTGWDGMWPVSERDTKLAAEAKAARGNFYDIAGTMVLPPRPQDVGLGPGAWTLPDPDIVPRTAAEDVRRRDTSAPLRVVPPYDTADGSAHVWAPMPYNDGKGAMVAGWDAADDGAPPNGVGYGVYSGFARPPLASSIAVHGSTGAAAVRASCVNCGGTGVAGWAHGSSNNKSSSAAQPIRCACGGGDISGSGDTDDMDYCPTCEGTGIQGYTRSTPPQAVRCHCRDPPPAVRATAAAAANARSAPGSGEPAQYEARYATQNDDGDSAFMVAGGLPSSGRFVTAAAARTAQHTSARAVRACGGGGSGRTTQHALRGVATVPLDAEYGTAVATGVPYDAAYPPRGTLGIPGAAGLRHMPGTVPTGRILAVRDAAAEGVPNPYTTGINQPLLPVTDALGFRFADRAQTDYARPRFFPARDPTDKLVYEQALAVAPQYYADAADHAALRSMELVEPLSSRYEMLKTIAADMTHERDAYMRPRTGPSVLNPGRLAQPPSWYVQPGSSSGSSYGGSFGGPRPSW